MAAREFTESVVDRLQPYWYVFVLAVALLGASFAFASRSLVFTSSETYVEASVYVYLQVTGWVILIEWLRLTGYLTLQHDK